MPLTARLTALGARVERLQLQDDTLELAVRNESEQKDLLVFAAVIVLAREKAGSTTQLAVSLLRDGQALYSIKTKQTDAEGLVAELVPESLHDDLTALLRRAEAAKPVAEAEAGRETPTTLGETAATDPGTAAHPRAEAMPVSSEPTAGDAAPRTSVAEPAQEPEGPLPGVTFHGPTGLLRTPNAEVLPQGAARLSITVPNEIVGHPAPDFREQWTTGIGVLPRLEAGAAYSNASVPNSLLWRDITLHGKLQLLREHGDWPSLAVGASNLRPAFGDPNYYAVMSKGLWNQRVRTSLGWGDGNIDGLFGGVEIRLAPWATGLAEYDADRINVGLRLRPTPRWQIDVADLKGGFSAQTAYTFQIGSVHPGESEPIVLPAATEDGTPEALADRMAEAVAGQGMDNVRVLVGERPEGLVAGLTYENRRYYRDELEALGRVVAAVARVAPERVRTLSVVVLDHQIPVLRCGLELDDYRAYLRGELAPTEFADRLSVDHGLRPDIHPSTLVADTSRARPTRFAADLSVTPTIRGILGSEDVTLGLRTALRPELDIDFGSGLSLKAAEEVRVSGDLADLEYYFSEDQVSLNYAFRVGPEFLGHIAGGDFADKRRGLAAEGFLLPDENPLLARGFLGWLQDRRFGGGLDHEWIYQGELRYWLRPIDASVGATFGKYLDLDTGYSVFLKRFFGDSEVQLEYRDTDYASILVFQATTPIAPRAYGKPGRTRVRVGDHVQTSWRAVASDESTTLDTASLIGNRLRFFDISEAFLNRDRFQPSAIREHIDVFRSAAAAVLAARQ